MSPSRQDDLDWLYGRSGPAEQQPEPTRVLGAPWDPGADQARPGHPAAVVSDQQPRPPAAGYQPSRNQAVRADDDAPPVDMDDLWRRPQPPSDGNRPAAGTYAYEPPRPASYPAMPAYGAGAPGSAGAAGAGAGAAGAAAGAPSTPWAAQPAGPGAGGPTGRGPGGPGDRGGAVGPGGRSGRARRTRRRHPVRTVFAILLTVVLLAAVALVGIPLYAWNQVGRVAYEPSGDRPAQQPGTTFLLVGSDSREGLTKAQRKKLGTGSTAGQRTDTIMLMFIPTGGKPALISLPRDSYVPVPGHGTNKINAAYAFGGPKLLVNTVEQSTGLRVDAYMEIGFGGFVGIIDSLGGIRMCLPKAIKDADSHLNLKKGCQVLDGTNALGYVRMRKADALGDLGRVQRQREMLAAVAAKAASPSTVLNPVSYWKVSTASAQALTLGNDVSLWTTGRMALAMKTIADGEGLTLTVPVSDPGASTPVGSAVIWDDTKAKAMFADLKRGDTSELSTYTK